MSALAKLTENHIHDFFGILSQSKSAEECFYKSVKAYKYVDNSTTVKMFSIISSC